MPKAKRPAPVFSDTELVDRVFEYVLELLPEASRQEMAGNAVNIKRAVREEFGGQQIYVAKRSAGEQHEMAAQVLRMFNGRNATEIARRLEISRATVYRLLKQPGT